MIVPVEKSIGQNSAYCHQIMKGASETERPSLFCKARTKTFQSDHLIHSVPLATLPDFVQPVLELKPPPTRTPPHAPTPAAPPPHPPLGIPPPPPPPPNI